jgi:hypothetical protein
MKPEFSNPGAQQSQGSDMLMPKNIHEFYAFGYRGATVTSTRHAAAKNRNEIQAFEAQGATVTTTRHAATKEP